jgi:hypothetical protein
MGSNNELKNTLTGQLSEQFANEDDLEERICENLKGIGYDL